MHTLHINALEVFYDSPGMKPKKIKGEKVTLSRLTPRILRGKVSCRGGPFFLVIDNLRVMILLTGYKQNGGSTTLCTEGPPRQLTSCSLFQIEIRVSTTLYVLMDHHDN